MLSYFFAGVVATQIVSLIIWKIYGIHDDYMEIGNIWVLWLVYKIVWFMLEALLTILLWVFKGFNASTRVVRRKDGSGVLVILKSKDVKWFDNLYRSQIVKSKNISHFLNYKLSPSEVYVVVNAITSQDVYNL